MAKAKPKNLILGKIKKLGESDSKVVKDQEFHDVVKDNSSKIFSALSTGEKTVAQSMDSDVAFFNENYDAIKAASSTPSRRESVSSKPNTSFNYDDLLDDMGMSSEDLDKWIAENMQPVAGSDSSKRR